MISIIIGVTGGIRKDNVKTVLGFIQKQKNRQYETILVEQYNCTLGSHKFTDSVYEKFPVTKYIGIRGNGGEYNLPWLYNIGARSARGKTLLFLDTDIVFSDNYLGVVSNFNKPFFFGSNKIICYTKEASESVRTKTRLTKDPKATSLIPGVKTYPGYCVGVQRDFFWNHLGGYNENYFGWGGLDNDIAHRAKTLIGQSYCLPKRIFHLWHPRGHANTLPKVQNTWTTTSRNPIKVNNRIKQKQMGKRSGPTLIDIHDIYVYKMKEK